MKFLVNLCTFVGLLSSPLLWAKEKRAPAERKPAAYVNEGSGYHLDPDLDLKIAENDKFLGEDQSRGTEEAIDIPIEVNNRVASWIQYFSQRERERTIRYFSRGSVFKRQIERILEQNGMPKELYFLAMIESGFVTGAQSHAEAKGIWQFVPGTAKNYGLQINRSVDERLNWIKSTEAAVIYLKDLKNVFGSWYLALAAYNAGEYRIVQAIMRGKTRDFWTLAEGNMLPPETLNYVPKFMAALIIGKNPEKYNIVYDSGEAWGDFDVVEAPSGVSFHELSKITEIPVDELKLWNPDVHGGRIPYDHKGRFDLYLPRARIAQFEAKQKQINLLFKRQGQGVAARNEIQGDYSIYVVKRKDTLSSIARTLGISIRHLRQINGIAQGRLHPGQRLRYPNLLAEGSNAGRIHVVQKNETLAVIAQKHRVSPTQIIQYNHLANRQVFEGQRLRVPISSDRKPGSATTANMTKVRKGDTWAKIAKRTAVPVKTLKALNPKKKTLQPGQEIRIR